MASQSFDISTGADLQEVDNSVNQARKEVAQRLKEAISFMLHIGDKETAAKLQKHLELVEVRKSKQKK